MRPIVNQITHALFFTGSALFHFNAHNSVTSVASKKSKNRHWQWDRELADLGQKDLDYLQQMQKLLEGKTDEVSQWQAKRVLFLQAWSETPAVTTISQQANISEPVVRKWKAQFNELEGSYRLYLFLDASKSCRGGRKPADEAEVMKAWNDALAEHGDKTRLADIEARCPYAKATIHRTLARKGISAANLWGASLTPAERREQIPP